VASNDLIDSYYYFTTTTISLLLDDHFHSHPLAPGKHIQVAEAKEKRRRLVGQMMTN
jgi:hypothetical protein